MLSVLIPTYNYNTTPLVEEVHHQCTSAGIVFEIIVQDDGSTDLEILEKNNVINGFSNCRFERNETNLGRSKTRNLLVKKAKYDWFLFLDSDLLPIHKTFIETYLTCIKSNKIISYGGIAYQKEKPQKEKLLRWVYGKKREEISLPKRLANPYQTSLTSNILIHKSIFEKTQFDEKIIQYGYEDLVFIESLKALNYSVHHLDASVFHLNYENSEAFLEKTKIGLTNLVELEKQKIIKPNTTKIQKSYSLLCRFKIRRIFLFFFSFFEKAISINLISKNPSLLLFDIYKLGYFCNLKNN